MSGNLSRNLRFIKQAARGKGAVAAKNQIAADVGARLLGESGNAVDAAIAAALALAVLEPWTSGLGSAGCMVLWDQAKRRGAVVDFPAILPEKKSLHSLVRSSSDSDRGDASYLLDAYRSIAVPGLLEGLWSAHPFGNKAWPALLAPAIELSEAGTEIDWYAFLAIEMAASELQRVPATRDWFLPAGLPSSHLRTNLGYRIGNPALTETLRALSERGARDFYSGTIADTIAADLNEGGSTITKNDIGTQHARVVDPKIIVRADKRYLLPPGYGTTDIFCSMMKADEDSSLPDIQKVINLAHALSAAHAELRLGDPRFSEWSSHISVIDQNGNVASVSQSLGALFGSKIVLPRTGILMNNYGSVLRMQRTVPDQSGVAAHGFLPIVGLSGDRGWLALGVSGDREILPALVQLISLITEGGYSLEDAFHQPRIGITRSGRVQIDSNAPSYLKKALQQIFKAIESPPVVYPFARPCAIAVGVDPFSGERVAMTEVTELWAGAAAAG
jgi:gamma-glutamyltranspeptidase/glutathione hydrolase